MINFIKKHWYVVLLFILATAFFIFLTIYINKHIVAYNNVLNILNEQLKNAENIYTDPSILDEISKAIKTSIAEAKSNLTEAWLFLCADIFLYVLYNIPSLIKIIKYKKSKRTTNE